MNKNIEILQLNDFDELVFLNYLNENYLILSFGDKELYVPTRNELLIGLIRKINFNREQIRKIQIVNHSLVLLNYKLAIVKYGERINMIVNENKEKLFAAQFPY